MGTKGILYRRLTVTLIFLSILLFSALASAAVTDFVAEGQDGKYYEYRYGELLESYVLHLLTGQGQIYADYAAKETRALLDSSRGYVDYADVLESYAVAVITKKPFDLNTYTASAAAQLAAMPDTVWVVGLGEDNKLTYTAKYLTPEETALRVVNEAASAEAMQNALLSHAGVLGLDLTEYNKLNAYGKNRVAAEVLAGRPPEGFTDLAAVAALFHAETEEAKALLTTVLTDINSAADKNALMVVILEKAQMLDICPEGYQKLTEEEKGKVADTMFPKKPFSSTGAVKSAFETAVAAAQSNMTVFYTSYNLTLKEMVDIQMTKDPQTDLYGGGWKSALRADVEYYVNPDNFVDPYAGEESRLMAKITASVLNVRERPTTASAILTKVYSGEMYLIEDAREGEPGTAAGTEGTWYRITANNVTGWVYGAYVEVTEATLSSSMFQFLVLSGNAGVSLEDLGKILSGKGILSGKETSFLEGSIQHNINEIFLVSLSLHETGNGKSTLANGIDFEDVDNLFPDQDTVKVYNMFGIGAYDSNPNYLGAQYAYNNRWFTPELAILGGAEFTSGSYINHSTYQQNTLYKMRWNPAKPGQHQYATDIGWASKQVGRVKTLYDQCSNYVLKFDIPKYKK